MLAGGAASAAADAQARAHVVPTEGDLRVQLAAAYRIAARLGWDEIIYNHISVRVPAPAQAHAHDRFLLNPFGLMFEEICASDLVEVDGEGNVCSTHEAARRYGINRAGFVVHAAVHRARPDVRCVVHTHTVEGTAVSASRTGLLMSSQLASQLGEIRYHEYRGIAVDAAEMDELARDLGPTASVMILRNHGLLTTGRTIGEAVFRMYLLVQACKVQVAMLAHGLDNVLRIDRDTVERNWAIQASIHKDGFGEREFEALVRKLERDHGTGYRH